MVIRPKLWILAFRLLSTVKIWNNLVRQLWLPTWLIDEQATLALVSFTVPKVKGLCQKLLVCNASHTWPYLAMNLFQFDPLTIGIIGIFSWNLCNYPLLLRRPLPIHARPWWQWRYISCHFTIRCINCIPQGLLFLLFIMLPYVRLAAWCAW